MPRPREGRCRTTFGPTSPVMACAGLCPRQVTCCCCVKTYDRPLPYLRFPQVRVPFRDSLLVVLRHFHVVETDDLAEGVPTRISVGVMEIGQTGSLHRRNQTSKLNPSFDKLARRFQCTIDCAAFFPSFCGLFLQVSLGRVVIIWSISGAPVRFKVCIFCMHIDTTPAICRMCCCVCTCYVSFVSYCARRRALGVSS